MLPVSLCPFSWRRTEVPVCAAMKMTHKRLAVAILSGWMAACTQRHAAQQPAPPPAPERDPNAKAEFELGPEALEARVKELTDGYLAMEVGQGELEKFKALELQLNRGLCYVAVLRLGNGAAFGPHARRGVKVVTAFELEDIVENDSAIVGPGVVLDAGCPLVDGHLVVDLQATFEADRNNRRFHELGTGPYTWTLYSAPITEKELADLKGRPAGEGGGKSRSVAATPASRGEQPQEIKPATDDGRPILFRNECPNSAKLFFGSDPSRAPGPTFAVKTGGTLNKQLRVGEPVWLVDAGGKGIALVTISDSVKEIVIARDCSGLAGK